MINEPSVDPYTDAMLMEYIERYPHMDEFGETPLDAWGLANSNWTGTWDLNAAAGDCWEEKAGTVAGKFDFTADGGNYSQSQQYEQYMKQCRYFRARRLPSTVRLVKSPEETQNDESWIGNLPEGD